MSAKSPNPIDKHVGSRVRMRRIMMGLSQEKLGDALGVTFQQVQKYEKGTNRIGASRLQRISLVLGVPISFFFDDMPEIDLYVEPKTEKSPNHLAEFLATSEGIALARSFTRIKDLAIRRCVMNLVEELAASAPGTP